jgi:hypothetical protein
MHSVFGQVNQTLVNETASKMFNDTLTELAINNAYEKKIDDYIKQKCHELEPPNASMEKYRELCGHNEDVEKAYCLSLKPPETTLEQYRALCQYTVPEYMHPEYNKN